MIKLNNFSVTTDDCDVTLTVVEFESIEHFLTYLLEEYEEDVNCIPVDELWDEETKSIVIEGDVWFEKWVVIDD